MEFRTRGQKVNLNPYQPEPQRPIDWMTESDLEANSNDWLVADSECYGNYWCLCFKNTRTKKALALESSPFTVFNKRLLSWLMHNYCTVGFNSIKYDLPMIWAAYEFPEDTEKLKRLSNALILENIRPRDAEKEFGFKIFPTRHIDLIEVAPLDGSLKTYGGRIHAKRLQDLPYDPYSSLSPDQMPIVKNYCVNDLDLTEDVCINLYEQLALRADLSNTYSVDLMSKSDAQLAETIVTKEVEKITNSRIRRAEKQHGAVYRYYVPPMIQFQTPYLKNILAVVAGAHYTLDDRGYLNLPTEIENLKINIGKLPYKIGNGGLHSQEKNTSHRAIGDVKIYDTDVSSYYPRIILDLELYPRHIGPVFLVVYRSLMERRLAAKAAKKVTEAENLKIGINGVFGKQGDVYSVVYGPENLIGTTMTGQLGLLMLVEAYELAGIEVINANTDGVVCKCRADQRATMQAIVKWWEGITNFVTEETEYTGYYSRDVNNYMAVKAADKDGKVFVKGKGAYLNPWSGSQDINKLKLFRFHKNPVTTICIEAATRYIIEQKPIAQTIMNSRDIREFITLRTVAGGAHINGEYLGKTVRWYYSKGSADSIRYVLNNNLVAESHGAKPCMVLPDEFPTDINYDHYITKAHKILDDVNLFGYKALLL
jgi:hypothetical protein